MGSGGVGGGRGIAGSTGRELRANDRSWRFCRGRVRSSEFARGLAVQLAGGVRGGTGVEGARRVAGRGLKLPSARRDRG